MNHTYRLVWNTESQRYVPAPECARSRGKGSRGKARVKPLALLLGLALAQAAFAAQPPAPTTLPTGGQVVAGQAGIAQSGSQMTVNQGSDKAIINWQSFNIGSQAGVTFVQPSTSAVALNRVIAGDASQIYGRLTANGQIWLINPNGVLFGAGSKVDVGGLVASTLATTNEDFLAGKAVFTRNGSTGRIVNQGEITASEGGLIALLAPTVKNEGILRAQLGNVVLAAGEKITLDAGADGKLNLAVTPATLKTLVENKQLIVADGGQVIMTAKAADALAGAVVANSGTVQAQTLAEHEGRILLLADMQHGEVKVGGTLDASAPQLPPLQGEGRGGDGSANGGFIETSATKVTLQAGHKVTTAANQGKTGTWLIDPNDYTIAASGGDITGSQLSTNLASTNVVIQSSSGATAGNGDINVNDAVSWSANTLTLTAARDININANLNGSGTAKLALAYGQSAVASGNTADYHVNNGAKVNLPAGQNFSTKLGSDGATDVYTVITDLGVAGDTSSTTLQGMKNNLSGKYVIGADIDASATAGWNGGAGWEPVGGLFLWEENWSSSFAGSLHGLGHSISGLTIQRPNDVQVGMFASTAPNSTIRNLYLRDAVVTAYGGVGVLVGFNDGHVESVYTNGVVIGGEDSVGGLVGGNWRHGSIRRSASTGTVSSLGQGDGADGVGGLAGYNSGLIENSYSAAEVRSESCCGVGGLVGWNSEYYAGDPAKVVNSYASGRVIGQDNGNGGLIGHGGGFTSGGVFLSSYWDVESSTQTASFGGTGLTTAQMKQQASFASWDFTNTWRIYEGQSYPVLQVFQKDLTVTANNAGKTYDGTAYSGGNGITQSTVGALSGAVTYSGNSQGATNAGSYAITPSMAITQQDYQNWHVSYVDGTLTINPAVLTTTITGNLTGTVQKTYDSTNAATLNASNFLLTGWVGSDGATVTKSTGTYDNANAGSGKTVTISLANGDYAATGSTNLTNYTLPTSISGNVGIIDKAALTVTANNASKTFDGNAWSGGNGVSYSGFVAGQDASILSGSLAYGGTSQGAVNAGNYTITPSGLTSGNYAIAFNNGALTVAPAAAPTRIAPPSGGEVWLSTQSRELVPPTQSQRPANDLLAGQQGNGNTLFLSLAPEFIRVGGD